MIICEECGKQVKKKVFCCDACRQKYARKALKGIVIERQAVQLKEEQPPKRSLDEIEPAIVYEDWEDNKNIDD
jgi:hypothetical protein